MIKYVLKHTIQEQKSELWIKQGFIDIFITQLKCYLNGSFWFSEMFTFAYEALSDVNLV